MADYDVVVIGAGPGGYVAAIRCAQLGLKTACVDAWVNEKGQPSLGGACLNVGCIPSKALLDSSHYYHALQHEYAEHGIKAKEVSVDIKTMMKRKDTIVDALTGGVSMLFTKNKIEWIKGHGRLLSNNTVEVRGKSKAAAKREITANNIIIATGSSPAQLESIPFDGKQIVDSTGALSFSSVPKRLGVIGAGVIGLELGSVWNRLGSDVTVFGRGSRFLKHADQQIADAALKELNRQGLNIKLGCKIVDIKKTTKRITIKFHDGENEQSLDVDKLLVAAGRKPNSAGLNADAVGLIINQRGFIEVDDQCRTSLQGVYAIGDVVRGPMLAHKASEEGVAVAERIAGEAAEVTFATVPWVIYTWPEIAWVGQHAESLEGKGIEYNSGVFPFKGNGRALALGTSTGMVKILSDKETDRILGVHIFGPNASELISEAVVAMEFSSSAEDLARTIHAHPTLSEAIHEAALAVDKRAIHI
jgi:dihydrolipoamide dehydrogenase